MKVPFKILGRAEPPRFSPFPGCRCVKTREQRHNNAIPDEGIDAVAERYLKVEAGREASVGPLC